MSLTVSCIYTRIDADGYGDGWKSSCGKKLRYETPEEVGWASAPLPTDAGRIYCTYCGKKIMLKK